MAKRLEKIIGTGANYPIELTKMKDENGDFILDEEGNPLLGWQMIKGDIKLIEQNIKNIVFTMVGQRLRQEEFGSRIHEILEEPNNRIIQHLSSKFITEAILQWEPRIENIKVSATSGFNKIELQLYYQIKDVTQEGTNHLSLTYNI